MKAIAWLYMLFFGGMLAVILLGLWLDPTLMTGPVMALFGLSVLLVLFGVVFLQFASRPRVVVRGDEIVVYDFMKKKRRISLRRINGRMAVPYTEENNAKYVKSGLRGVPGKALIVKLLSYTERWKNEYMEKMVYYANGEEVLTIHTGMKNGARLDNQIVESLEQNWGYEFDGGNTMGVVPSKEKVQATSAILRHFTEEKDAEQYLKQMIVVDSSIKILTWICVIGTLICGADYWMLHIIYAEICLPVLMLFGFFVLIMGGVWLAQDYTKSRSIKTLKQRQELILAADQLYALGGLGKKEDKLKITPDFVFTNFAAAIVPLDEIIWVYVKNTEYNNELNVGTRDGRIIGIGSYKANSGSQQLAAYNLLEEYFADVNILWGYNSDNEAIFQYVTKQK
ncbi:MAG: hypothetical protein IJ455_00950 [Agathobacter sp.]|nr:hypothetical protein [Agathobacter sp.]